MATAPQTARDATRQDPSTRPGLPPIWRDRGWLYNLFVNPAQRMNVWSHILGGLLFFGYGTVRLWLGQRRELLFHSPSGTQTESARDADGERVQGPSPQLWGLFEQAFAAVRAEDLARVAAAAQGPALDSFYAARERDDFALRESLQAHWRVATAARKVALLAEVPLNVTADVAHEREQDVFSAALVAHLVAVFTVGLLYAVSGVYHASVFTRDASAYLRWLDRVSIYATLASSRVASLLVAALLDPRAALATRGPNALSWGVAVCQAAALPWETWGDPCLQFGVVLLALSAYRFGQSPASTWSMVGFDHYGDRRDTFRPGHVDGEFEEVFGILFTVNLALWIVSLAYELEHFYPPLGALNLAVNGVGLLVLVASATNDLSGASDRSLARSSSSCLQRFMPVSHTIWHLAALLFSAMSTIVREIALTRALELTGC